MRIKIELSKTNHKRLVVTLPYSEERIAKIRRIEGRRWHGDKKVWTIPADDTSISTFRLLFSNEYVDYSDLKKYKNLFENVFPNKQFEDNENKRGVCTLNRLNDESRELLDKLTKKIALKGYSRETSKSYTSNITHFMAFSKNNVINSELIELYIMYLLKEKKCKTSTINQIISSLIFFCKYILEDYSLIEPIEHLKKEKRLPVVLNQDEVKKLLNSIDNLKHRAIFYTLYSSGLRLSEVIRLKASCIDPQRELIFVSGGKGKKDRYSLLSAKTLNVLLQYMEDYKPENWLFPGQRKGTHLSKRSVQHLCKG